MERFKLDDRQKEALKRLEDAANELSRTGVTLLFDDENQRVYAVSIPEKERENLDSWCNCNPPYDEKEYEDVTGEICNAATNVNIYGIFMDSDYIFGIRRTE